MTFYPWTPRLAQVGPMTYGDMLALFDGWLEAADGCHWEIRTRSLPALTPDAIDVITTAVAGRTSPYSMVNWHHFHGAATRIPAEEIAFGLRQEHFMVEIVAGWKPDGKTAQCTGDGRGTFGKASPHLRYPAATPTCWGRMIANRPRMPTAATAPG